jgi:ribosome production factor 1
MFPDRFLIVPWEQFRGRRAVTFHNQRDFIFFRHHRYIFETREDGKERKEHKGHLAKEADEPRLTKDAKNKLKSKKIKKEVKDAAAGKVSVSARLQELGPRFCLRLQSLNRGTFNSKSGEFEWIRNNGKSVTRKKFVL